MKIIIEYELDEALYPGLEGLNVHEIKELLIEEGSCDTILEDGEWTLVN